LVFGSAWHIGQEHLLLNDLSPKAAVEAAILAMEYYRQHFPPETDELFTPKTMTNLTNSLSDYADKYRALHRNHTVLYTELGGVVLVGENRTMAFKCDAIIRDESGHVFGIDHKTSQRRYTDWGDRWTLSTQMLTYLHALQCLFPDQEEVTMLVRCAFFYKKDPTIFEEHPIAKNNAQMQAWLERTNQWIDRLFTDLNILKEEDNTDEVVMRSFPQNDLACFDFGQRCEFFDFCNAWPNPLTRCDETPIGFNVEWWDPLARPEIRTTVNLKEKERP